MAILGIDLSDFRGEWLSTYSTESKPIITKHTESKPTLQNSLIRFSTSILGTWNFWWHHEEISIGRPDDHQKRHSNHRLRSTAPGEGCKGWCKSWQERLVGGAQKRSGIFVRIFFSWQQKVSQVKLWVWVFFFEDWCWFLEWFHGLLLKSMTRQVLRIRVSGRFIIHLSINLESKHWCLGSITGHFEYKTFLPFVGHGSFKTPPRSYVNTWPYIWKINTLWWKSERNLPHAHLHLPLGTFLFKSGSLCLQNGPSSRWSEKPLNFFPLRLLYLFLIYLLVDGQHPYSHQWWRFFSHWNLVSFF